MGRSLHLWFSSHLLSLPLPPSPLPSKFKEKVVNLTRQFRDRKMNTQQRKNFASLTENAVPFACLCLLYLVIAEGSLRSIFIASEDEISQLGTEDKAATEAQLRRDPIAKILMATLSSTERNLANVRGNTWGKLVAELISSIEPQLKK